MTARPAVDGVRVISVDVGKGRDLRFSIFADREVVKPWRLFWLRDDDRARLVGEVHGRSTDCWRSH